MSCEEVWTGVFCTQYAEAVVLVSTRRTQMRGLHPSSAPSPSRLDAATLFCMAGSHTCAARLHFILCSYSHLCGCRGGPARQSSCQLEVDGCVEHVLNRLLVSAVKFGWPWQEGRMTFCPCKE